MNKAKITKTILIYLGISFFLAYVLYAVCFSLDHRDFMYEYDIPSLGIEQGMKWSNVLRAVGGFWMCIFAFFIAVHAFIKFMKYLKRN